MWSVVVKMFAQPADSAILGSGAKTVGCESEIYIRSVQFVIIDDNPVGAERFIIQTKGLKRDTDGGWFRVNSHPSFSFL